MIRSLILSASLLWVPAMALGQDNLSLDTEVVTVLGGVEAVEQFGSRYLATTDEGGKVIEHDGSVVTVTAPASATIDLIAYDESLAPVPVERKDNRWLITKPGNIWIDVVVVEVVGGLVTIERERTQIVVGDPAEPPPADDLLQLEELSRRRSLAVADPPTRTKLCQAYKTFQLQESVEASLDEFEETYLLVMAQRVGESRDANWEKEWYIPVEQQLKRVGTTLERFDSGIKALTRGLDPEAARQRWDKKQH